MAKARVALSEEYIYIIKEDCSAKKYMFYMVIIAFIAALLINCGHVHAKGKKPTINLSLNGKCAVIMDADTGKVIYKKMQIRPAIMRVPRN